MTKTKRMSVRSKEIQDKLLAASGGDKDIALRAACIWIRDLERQCQRVARLVVRELKAGGGSDA